MSDAWTVSLGLRYDKIHLNDMKSELWADKKEPAEIKGHYSPRFATAYELDADTTIKASYQHGFRTPDAFYYVLNLQYRDLAEKLGLSTTNIFENEVPPMVFVPDQPYRGRLGFEKRRICVSLGLKF